MATAGKAKPARHVYKTGAAGCGGKVVPAKNCGLPLPCPFCDRIFKQDGRLKEHLKNKHADGGPDGRPAGPDGDFLKVQAVPVGADEYNNNNNHGLPAKQLSYTIKTPKTLLYEWCQKNKRPVPKFKHVEEEGGFHCRVVLPDAKNTEADVILWYRDAPTRSSQEAQHRAAVVGLHHLLGNRRLDRILAEEYREQWHNLDLAAERRRAYLKANPPQPRPKSAPLPRELHSVFMSEDNRRLVEGLLREHEDDDIDATLEMPCSISGDANHDESRRQRLGGSIKIAEGDRKENRAGSSEFHVQLQDTEKQQNTLERGSPGWRDLSGEHRTAAGIHGVRRKLLSLGFKACHVKAALSGRDDLSSALDWLILNVPEQELPIKFAPDSSKASVQVLVRGNLPASLDASSNVNEGRVSRLQEYGYPFDDCVTALSAANGDEGMALCKLFHSAFDTTNTNFGARSVIGSPTQVVDVREEESRVLNAIFGAGAVLISESCSVFLVSISESSAANLEMEVRITPGSSYPFEVPVIAFRSAELAAEYLLDLTRQVVRKAISILGRPMIHELVLFATNFSQTPGFRYRSKWDLHATTPSMQTTRPLLNETEEPGEKVLVCCLSNGSRSTQHGADLPKGKAYVPPALRHAASGTANEEQLEAINTHAGLQPRRKVSDQIVGVYFEKENTKLKIEWEELQCSSRHADIWAVRSGLPAFHQRDALLSAVKSYHVTVVAGQTGCGKSTQVPQYVLEDYIERGEGAHCNVICTQPRRLSAIGLADRVSKERGQAVGETVGYTVRLESSRSQHTRILFCTTGILLRRLMSDPDLKGVTHVIVDEVHERSLDSDLLLLLLRKLLHRLGRIRVILMSATVDTELFVRYFREEMQFDPYVVHIPGLTYPVQELYLEDALDLTGYKVGRNSRYAMRKKASSSEAVPNNASSRESGPDFQDMDSWESLAGEKADEGMVAADVYSESTVQSLSIVDQSLINYDLIELVICAILQNTVTANTSTTIVGDKKNGSAERNQNSAVLVFLPGVAEIHRLGRQLKSSSQIATSHSESLWVLALHGSLSGEEQRKVFSRPSLGTRKIVLATNIAETSVTIDDIVYVIDCGRHKEVRFDHNRGITCLEETWISKASAKQRRGRAGRVQAGYCIRLYSRHQFQTFEDQQIPEILRVSLDGLCLTMKSFFEEKIEDTAAKVITPPELDALVISLQNLQNLNALDAAEKLTPLGHHLARMPVDARVGKMLLFGCMLRCLDPVATIAAALSARTPFLSPVDKRDEASAARLQFTGSSKSDHWTIVGAYNGWLNARQEGRNAEINYCMMNFLSREAMMGIEASRQEFFKILADIGFFPGTGKGMNRDGDANDLDSNSSSVRVVKAVICAGFYPNIVKVLHPEKTFVQTEGGTVAKIAAARELRFFTKTDGRVFLHPASVNFSVGKYESPWLVFSEKMKTSKVFLKDSTMVPAYGLLLFGGKVQVNHERQSISVDDWLEFEAPARIAVLIKEMRLKVDSLLFEKIRRPAMNISSSPVVSALIRLLTTDGF